MRKKKHPPRSTPAPVPPPRNPLLPAAALYFIAGAIIVCFWPLADYFFAQDDFILLDKASSDAGTAFARFFSSTPGQFRPFSKVLYFAAMHSVFGLNAAAYHAVSFMLHIVNTLLVFALLRRCRVGAAAATCATAFFALNVAFFHVLAWISCIQQLLGLCFTLVAILFGIDALERGSKRALWISAGAYALALMSKEQTFGVPIVLILYRHFLANRRATTLGQTLRAVWPHVVLFAAYAVLMGVWKGVPDEGPYRLSLGGNVFANVLTYFGWSFDFGVDLPLAYQPRTTLSLTHGVGFVLVAYHALRRRFGVLAFGLGYFVLAILPVAFLSNHVFFLHTYIPAFGLVYLIGVALDDVFALSSFRARTPANVLVVAVLLVAAAVSWQGVRANIRDTMPQMRFPKSFVLRRAMIARHAWDHLLRKKGDTTGISDIYLVYGRESGRDKAKWNRENVEAALGQGSLGRLVYGNPDLNVHFMVVGDPGGDANLATSHIYYYDDWGNCYTPAEAPTE
ncbi:MAG: hypothetical protein IH969_00155 [Candidatus Krumholzibacteriota bacterium]|nr:hypothetical protein [Candidatus Krumholzibacteriota bacterium]